MTEKKHVRAEDLQLIVGMALAGANRDTVLLPEIQAASDGVANWQPVLAPRTPGDQKLMEQLRTEYEVQGWPGRSSPAPPAEGVG